MCRVGWEVPSALMLLVKASEEEEGKAEYLQPVPPTGSACPSYPVASRRGSSGWMPSPPAVDAVGNDSHKDSKVWGSWCSRCHHQCETVRKKTKKIKLHLNLLLSAAK